MNVRRRRLFRRAATITAAVVALGALPGGVGTSLASPPSGLATFTDIARGRLAGDHPVVAGPHSGITAAAYTLPAGADSGWRRFPGSAIIAVSVGTLTVRAAAGCTLTRYGAGAAAVLTAGEYLMANQGSAPAAFGGVVLGLSGRARPTIDQLPVDGARCHAPGGAGLLIAEAGRATFVGPDGYHTPDAHADHAMPGQGAPGHLTARGGRDIGMEVIRFVGGSSLGWHTHPGPALVVVEQGSIEYWTDRDGACVPAGDYHHGDAYVIAPYPGHHHIAYAPDDGEALVIYLDLPSTFAALPMLGMVLDGNDFTPLPPPGCPRLRDQHI